MARLSEYLLPTEKEAPADAEATSHKLMVRAGLIRQMGAGMWMRVAECETDRGPMRYVSASGSCGGLHTGYL